MGADEPGLEAMRASEIQDSCDVLARKPWASFGIGEASVEEPGCNLACHFLLTASNVGSFNPMGSF
jgi:hypothetical protein